VIEFSPWEKAVFAAILCLVATFLIYSRLTLQEGPPIKDLPAPIHRIGLGNTTQLVYSFKANPTRYTESVDARLQSFGFRRSHPQMPLYVHPDGRSLWISPGRWRGSSNKYLYAPQPSNDWTTVYYTTAPDRQQSRIKYLWASVTRRFSKSNKVKFATRANP